jgi:hypothetical protein
MNLITCVARRDLITAFALPHPLAQSMSSMKRPRAEEDDSEKTEEDQEPAVKKPASEEPIQEIYRSIVKKGEANRLATHKADVDKLLGRIRDVLPQRVSETDAEQHGLRYLTRETDAWRDLGEQSVAYELADKWRHQSSMFSTFINYVIKKKTGKFYQYIRPVALDSWNAWSSYEGPRDRWMMLLLTRVLATMEIKLLIAYVMRDATDRTLDLEALMTALDKVTPG